MDKKISINGPGNFETTTTCSYDCGGRCLLKIRIKDGKVSKISSKGIDGLNISACPRGLVQKDVLYHPKRLMRPLKRTGERGSGVFEEISWDDALSIIVKKIRNTVKKHGTESIYFVINTGSQSTLNHTAAVTERFFSMLGKCTTVTGNISFEAAVQSSFATFGTSFTGSSRENILSSKLIILWGWNPNITRFGSDTIFYLTKAKKSGTRIICVDPRHNHSGQVLANRWLPIKPGTDTAMLIAMAHEMITNNLYDKEFTKKHTSGFDKFCDYVTGVEDDIVKDPEWASSICGISPGSIKELAREYAAARPAALMTGWAPGRTAYGEQFHRAASIVAAITGNIGIEGGFVSGGTDQIDIGRISQNIFLPDMDHNLIHKTEIYDALIHGRSAGYASDCRLLYITGCNMLNQFLNLNKGKRALMSQDFIITHELFLTPTARFADIILPAAHFLEYDDIGQPWSGGPYTIFMHKASSNTSGPKSDLEIFTEIAERIGIKNYNEKPDSQWLGEFLESEPSFPGLVSLKDNGTYKFDHERPIIAFKKQIEDPGNNPFPTPSGKIEIFSDMFARLKDPSIPPIPKYIASREGPEDDLVKDYPIQLISPHSRARINSQLDNIKSMEKLKDDRLWMSTEDAGKRDIKDGDTVHVFNKRGRISTQAKVTNKIMSGVASIDQGQWYDPDSQGVDHGGCANMLTLDRRSPAGAFISNTCLVQIEKA
jgi:anaerobic dimethyl sulfoxide reductase subunit A